MQPIRFGTHINLIAPGHRPEGLREVKEALTINQEVQFEADQVFGNNPDNKAYLSLYTNTIPGQHINMKHELDALMFAVMETARKLYSTTCDMPKIMRQFVDLTQAAEKGHYPSSITVDFTTGKVGASKDIEQQ